MRSIYHLRTHLLTGPGLDTVTTQNSLSYGHSNFQQCASVTLSQDGQVFLHSSLPCFEPVQPISGFKNVSRGIENQSLWVSLDYNGEGSWIPEGMPTQSLIIIHNESCTKEISPSISPAATMISVLPKEQELIPEY